MCGIVGILGSGDVAPRILQALRRLEYRGYDSAGIAVLRDGGMARARAPGKLDRLASRLDQEPLRGPTGIGHTRWATHGVPNETNAHPHVAGAVAIVHNGIIENFRELRDELIARGKDFTSQTDTEVVAHLIDEALAGGRSPNEAVRAVLGRLRGAFAFVILFQGEQDLMIGARRGSPLAVGHGDGEMFLGSDSMALAPFTNRITYLDEGDWVVLTRGSCAIFDSANRPVERPMSFTQASSLLVDKGNHRHFMAKEIFEQPEVIGHTLAEYIDFTDRSVVPGMGTGLDLSPPRQAHHHRLRHRVLRGADGEILVRAGCPHPHRGRYRIGVPLPRGASRSQRPDARHLAVRRNRRHAGRLALRPGQGPDRRRGGECPRIHHRARKRYRVPNLCRTRDRRRFDQGLHLPAGGPGVPRHRRRPRRATRYRARRKNGWSRR